MDAELIVGIASLVVAAGGTYFGWLAVRHKKQAREMEGPAKRSSVAESDGAALGRSVCPHCNGIGTPNNFGMAVRCSACGGTGEIQFHVSGEDARDVGNVARSLMNEVQRKRLREGRKRT